jgi:hypothetical protein
MAEKGLRRLTSIVEKVMQCEEIERIKNDFMMLGYTEEEASMLANLSLVNQNDMGDVTIQETTEALLKTMETISVNED